MKNEKIILTCDLCGSKYQHGPHRYEGHKVERYGIMVCDTCWQSNWDGWAPQYEARILEHAKAQGLTLPDRNKNGLLPRE